MYLPLVALFGILGRDATPQLTVKACMDAYNQHDWKGFFSRLDGAKVQEAADQLAKMPNMQLGKMTMEIVEMHAADDTATANVRFNLQERPSLPGHEVTDEIRLTRTAGDWKIVGGNGAVSSFTQFVMAGQHPEQITMARGAAKRTQILSNMKQIAVGMLIFANDYDDKLAFNQETMHQKLKPYLRTDALWKGPDGEDLDVRINPSVVGKVTSKIESPAECVMLTLGPKDKLVFMDGRTPVAFVDGHVKYFNRDQVSLLHWK